MSRNCASARCVSKQYQSPDFRCDVAFLIDAEFDVEAALRVPAYPWHAPAVALQDPHWYVEDVGVARERTPGLGKAVKEVAPVPIRAHAVRPRVGDGGEVAERRSDSQVVGLPGRLAEILAAAVLPRFLRRPNSVQAEGLVAVVAGAVEPDLLAVDFGPGAGLANAVRERDALNVLNVFQQCLEILNNLRPLGASEVAGLGPIMGVTLRGLLSMGAGCS